MHCNKMTCVSPNNFFTFLGLMIVAAPASRGGKNLFESEYANASNGQRKITSSMDYSSYTSMTRFDLIRSKFSHAVDDLHAQPER